MVRRKTGRAKHDVRDVSICGCDLAWFYSLYLCISCCGCHLFFSVHDSFLKKVVYVCNICIMYIDIKEILIYYIYIYNLYTPTRADGFRLEHATNLIGNGVKKHNLGCECKIHTKMQKNSCIQGSIF